MSTAGTTVDVSGRRDNARVEVKDLTGGTGVGGVSQLSTGTVQPQVRGQPTK